MIHLEIKQPKRITRRINLPLLSNEAWAILGIGMIGGIIGATIHTMIILPFCK